VAHFIGFELVLNIENGNGRDRGEQTGLIPEKTSSTHHGRSGCEKRTHNISLVLKGKSTTGSVDPTFKLVAGPDAGNLGGVLAISQTWCSSN